MDLSGDVRRRTLVQGSWGNRRGSQEDGLSGFGTHLNQPEEVARYPSSTLFPFYFGVSLLRLNIRKRVPVFLWGYWRSQVGFGVHLGLWLRV